MESQDDEHPSTKIFRDYIRIPSVHPNPDYSKTVEFLISRAEMMALPYTVCHCAPDKPTLVVTWPGTNPSLSSVLLNSHMDVVPVFPEHWTYPPFSAHKDDQGNIYGRGTQDMKCVGIQHLEAVRRLKEQGKKLKRTVHICYVPDEEIDGEFGMMGFVKTEAFKNLNVGFSMDEGMASVDDELPLYYGERSCFWIKVTCPGSPGHGSRFLPNTAGEKARKEINKLLEYRDKEERRLETNPELTLGDVTTVNLTLMQGGVQVNVVPDMFILNFDIRISPTTDMDQFEDMLRGWLREAGDDVTMEFIVPKHSDQTLTSVDQNDPWFAALNKAFVNQQLNVAPQIFAANTDSRHLRAAGVAAFGFSPMPNTKILLHDHDECLNEKTFLKGIDIFAEIIENVANV